MSIMKQLGKRIIDGLISSSHLRRDRYLLRTANYVADAIRSKPGTFAFDIHELMRVDSFLPISPTTKSPYEATMDDLLVHDGRIRIRIVYPSGTSWNCIGTFYDELIHDARYQVFILTENYPRYIDIMNEHKCPFALLESYDLKLDRPDVLVLTSYSNTHKNISFEGANDYVSLVISLFPNIVVNEPNEVTHWQYVRNAYTSIQPDYYLFDNLPFNSSKKYLPSDICINIGNPQIDEVFNRLHDVCNSKPFEKLEGKTVFLWATDHGIQEYCQNPSFVSAYYFTDFFAFFASHEELGLIVRPHPYLIRELTQKGDFWTYDDYRKVKNYCDNSPNIVWDDSPDYCSAYIRSDAMFVDVNCGMTVSYLCTGKPICRLVHGVVQDSMLIHPELKDGYYFAADFTECETFIQNCLKNTDPKREVRHSIFEKAINKYDGQNGHRIKAFLEGALSS